MLNYIPRVLRYLAKSPRVADQSYTSSHVRMVPTGHPHRIAYEAIKRIG